MGKLHNAKLKKLSQEFNDLTKELNDKSKIIPRTEDLKAELKVLSDKQSKLRKRIEKLNGEPPAEEK